MTTKKQLTMNEVLDQGKRIAFHEREDGSTDDFREADGLVFDIMANADGHISGMWCMGKKTRVVREYGIKLD